MYQSFFRTMGFAHCKRKITENLSSRDISQETIDRVIDKIEKFYASEERSCIMKVGDYRIEIYGNVYHSNIWISRI